MSDSGLIFIIAWVCFGLLGLTILSSRMRLNFSISILFIVAGPIGIFLALIYKPSTELKKLPTSRRKAVYKKSTTNTKKLQAVKNDVANEKLSVVEIIETHRIEEPIGNEIREIDNSQSDIQVGRKFSVSREWAQSCTLDYEKLQSGNGEISISVAGLVSLKATLEKTVSEKYSISNSSKRTYTEEILLTIPAKTNVRVNLRWKQVWQCGIVRLQNNTGTIIEIPFRVLLEPTFDQQHIDYAT